MFLLLIAFAIFVVVVVVVRVLPFFIMMTINTIQRFVLYMPLLAVGIMTHSYLLGSTYYRNGMYHIL